MPHEYANNQYSRVFYGNQYTQKLFSCQLTELL